MLIFAGILFVLVFYRALVAKSKKKALKIPVFWLVVYAAINISIPVFEYSNLGNIAESLSIASSAVLAMAVIRLVVFIVVDYFIRHRNEVVIPTITRDFILGILYVITAMIVIKHRTNVNLGSILTTSAILTAVIGFAMQDTLGNLFSGLALQLEHPYQIGDWISFEGTVGKVVGITWKSTKILTRSEEMIFVPNNTISKSTLVNLSRPTPRHAASVEFSASYEDPPHKVRKTVVDIMTGMEGILKDPPPAVRIARYDSTSIAYKAFFITEDIAGEERIKMDILGAIWYRFRNEKIRIPYPIQETWQIDKKEVENLRIALKKREEDETIRTLDGLEIFRDLPGDTKRELAEHVAVLAFAEGETIVRQDDKSGPMYIIQRGKCGVFVAHEGHPTAKIATLGEGAFFGEMSVLTGEPRIATIMAETDVVCCEIDKGDMQLLFSKHPQLLAKAGEALIRRRSAISEYKSKLDEESHGTNQQGHLVAKIKSFLGL
jgi:small-conductance mechanosensitive channel/CRP-like cAMP-binding protein